MTNTQRLVVVRGGPGAGKTAALLARYSTMAPEDRARAAFITVNGPSARELERRLRESDAGTPTIWTLAHLPGEALRAASGAAPRAITETDRQRLLAWILAEEADKPDAPARVKSWAQARRAVAADVSAAIGLLQRCRVSPEEFRAFAAASANADTLGAIAQLHDAYMSALSGSDATDFDGLNERALRALEARRPGLPDLLFVDEAQEMDALQARLVAALAGPSGRIVAAVDTVQRTQMYRGATPDATAALAAAMGEPAYLVDGADGPPTGAVGAMAAGFGYEAGSVRSPSVGHIVARTAADEARLVAEAIRETPGRWAALTRSNGAATALRDALRREGIAVVGAALGSAPAQRFLRDALTLLRDTRPDDADLGAARWRSAARLSGSSGSAVSGAMAAHPALPEPARGWVEDARTMGTLARQVHRLFLLSGWLARLPEDVRDAAARAYSGAIGSLMDLEEMWRIARPAAGPLPPAEALADLPGILLAAAYPGADPPADEDAGGPHAAGLVDVLPIHQAAGRHWDHVVLCELQDGGFPQHPTRSPFVSEAAAAEARAWLEGREGRAVAMGRFERRAEVTVEEERRLFLTALSRATNTVTLATYVWENGHPVAPSWFFQRLRPSGMALSPEAPRGWRCLLRDTLPVEVGGLTGCGACRVRRCSGRTDGEAPAPPAFEAADPVIAPAVEVDSPALRPDWTISASALKTFYACPRKFFLANALRLGDEEDADSLVTGSVLHEITERFHRSAPPRTRETLDNAIEEVFAEEGWRERFSSPAAWRLTQRKMRRALTRYFHRAEYRDATDPRVEKWIAFSLKDGSGAPHGFNGRMDFAIEREDGLAIVDFKTSQAIDDGELFAKLPSVTEGGTVELKDDGDVQLALYAAAALAEGKTPASVSHEYITVSKPNTGGRATIPIIPREEVRPGAKHILFREDLEAMAVFFAETARRIKETPAFAADPASGECRPYFGPCPFVTACDRERSDP